MVYNNSISDITTTTAISGGNITSDGGAAITARGVCWSTSANPTTANAKATSGTGIGSFTANLTGLTVNTTYYVRAYATNSTGTYYSSQLSFRTISTIQLKTSATSNITATTATSGGEEIETDSRDYVTGRGVCWSTSPNPTITNNKISNGSGTWSFSSSLTGLTANTTYYVRAYATNNGGTYYGQQVSFKTSSGVIALTTTAVSGISPTTAISGGNITSNGDDRITERGICWSTSQNPTTVDAKSLGTSIGGYNYDLLGGFAANLSGLKPNTTYYVRAYAKNGIGTYYGVQTSFKTPANSTGSEEWGKGDEIEF